MTRGSRRGPRRLVLAAVVAGGALVAWFALGRGHSTAGVALDPSAFAPGACVAYPPTSGDRHVTVFLDAGHGGLDPGAVGTTSSGARVDEGAVTLPVELDTAAQLRSAGFRVVVSRTEDSNVARLGAVDLSDGVLSLQGAHDDVVARDVCANLSGARALVGIYFDSGSSPSDGGSVTTYDTARSFSPANLRLATLLQRHTLAAMNAQGWQIPDDGVRPDSVEGSLVPTTSTGSVATGAAHYGHVLLLGPAAAGYFASPSLMPGALIEPLFVTDPFEGTLAARPSAQEVVATGIARGIEAYLGGTTSK